MDSSKGITLIALVITIIVLLILAGVTISMVVGDNGILTNAKNAGDKTALAEAKDTVRMAVADATTQYYADVNGTGVNTDIGSTLNAYVAYYLDATRINITAKGITYSFADSTVTLTQGETSVTATLSNGILGGWSDEVVSANNGG